MHYQSFNPAPSMGSISSAMIMRGWSITPDTLLDTARSLGFVVIGVQIFLPDYEPILKVVPGTSWKKAPLIDHRHTVRCPGRNHIWVNLVTNPWEQFFFSDETEQFQGPWLTVEEAEAQLEMYTKYTLGTDSISTEF